MEVKQGARDGLGLDVPPPVSCIFVSACQCDESKETILRSLAGSVVDAKSSCMDCRTRRVPRC